MIYDSVLYFVFIFSLFYSHFSHDVHSFFHVLPRTCLFTVSVVARHYMFAFEVSARSCRIPLLVSRWSEVEFDGGMKKFVQYEVLKNSENHYWFWD